MSSTTPAYWVKTFSWYQVFTRGVFAISLETGEKKEIIDWGYDPYYLSTGYLVFTHYGRLMAAPFDNKTLEITGEVVSVIDDLRTEIGAGQFTVSQTGTLMYVPGVSAMKANLVFRTINGDEENLPIEPDFFGQVQISPNGEMLSIVNEEHQDIYSYHIPSRTINRLTSDGQNRSAIWGPDNGEITFNNNEAINLVQSSGVAEPTEVLSKSIHTHPLHWSLNGKVLMYGETSTESKADIGFHFTDKSSEDLLLTPNT